ncbi:hypothetical protein ACFS07_14010 [Undibacterium arcticum]
MITVVTSVIIAVVVPVAMLTPAAAMLTVARNVDVVIPTILDEIDPLTAGIVSIAILAPVLGMARRHMQVERWACHSHRLDDDRLRVDQLWRRHIADVNAAIKKPGSPTLTETPTSAANAGTAAAATVAAAAANRKRFIWKNPFSGN